MAVKPVLLLRVRVADLPKPPTEPHRIVECATCHARCYSLLASDADVLTLRRVEYKCIRCQYVKDPKVLEMIMDGAVYDVNAH